MHIGEGQPHFSVDRAQEVEGDGELEEEAVDQDQVSDRHVARGDLLSGHVHDEPKGRAEDGPLAKVEGGQAGLGLESGRLVLPQVFVVLLHLVLFVVKVLDSLIVDQRVDGAIAGQVLGPVQNNNKQKFYV